MKEFLCVCGVIFFSLGSGAIIAHYSVNAEPVTVTVKSGKTVDCEGRTKWDFGHYSFKIKCNITGGDK